MWAYSNDGASMRMVGADTQLDAGELSFDHELTNVELAAAFSGFVSIQVTVRQQEVNAVLQSKTDAGFNYNGNNFQIDANAISNMQTIMIAFAIGQTNPQNGVWRSSSNVNVAMDDTACKTFILAVQAYVSALLFNSWALKDAISHLTTLAAVNAYDITSGWPAN